MDNSQWRKNLSENLVRLRKQNGITQSELGSKLNYSDKSVSKWERGDGVPDLSVIVQLSELYHVSIDELLGREKKAENREGHTASPLIRHATVLITLCAIVFLTALMVFACLTLFAPSLPSKWMCFVGALPIMSLGAGIMFLTWKDYPWAFGALSIALWTACLFLQQLISGVNAGLIYAIGGMIQLAALVAVGFIVMHKSK